MRGCDGVFHSAAAYPRAERDLAGWVSRSVTQMRAVLQAASAARVSRFVYTSTSTTIGFPSEPGRQADERDFYVPGTSRSIYYEAKFAMEMEVFRAAAEGLPAVILNPTAVFGPGDVKPTTAKCCCEQRGRFVCGAIVNAVDVRSGRPPPTAASEDEWDNVYPGRTQSDASSVDDHYASGRHSAAKWKLSANSGPSSRLRLAPLALRISSRRFVIGSRSTRSARGSD
jgi:nucleoside-diphosphate-sugar epimerase